MLARHFAALQTPHWEQWQVRVTSLSSYTYLHNSPHLLQLYPPPLPVSNPGPFPQGLRAAAGSTQLHGIAHLLLPSTGAQTSPSSSLKQGEEQRRRDEDLVLSPPSASRRNATHRIQSKSQGVVGRRWEPETTQNGQHSQTPSEIRGLWKCTHKAIPFTEVILKWSII